LEINNFHLETRVQVGVLALSEDFPMTISTKDTFASSVIHEMRKIATVQMFFTLQLLTANDRNCVIEFFRRNLQLKLDNVCVVCVHTQQHSTFLEGRLKDCLCPNAFDGVIVVVVFAREACSAAAVD
jgi:hypothetical protein